MFIRPSKVHMISGMTLLELIIAMSLSVMLLGFSTFLYVFENKLVYRWQNKAYLNDQALFLINSLSSPLSRLDEISNASFDRFIFSTFDGKVVEIKFGQTGNLNISGKNILPSGYHLTSFSMNYLSYRSEEGQLVTRKNFELDDNLNYLLEGDELSQIDAIEFNFEIGYKTYSESFSQIIALRNKPISREAQ
jgi:hypothetical protein